MSLVTSVDRFAQERELFAQRLVPVAGVDEAGRGPLAGPVLAAAVILPQDWIERGIPSEWATLNDSKQLSPAQRDRFFEQLTTHPAIRYGVAQVEADEIDRINILQATHQAMNAALDQLVPCPLHVLVDGRRVASLRIPQTPLVHGDARSYSIAAASVLAKVTRDRLMCALDSVYPGYGFARHKGYGTAEHRAALVRLGPTPIHRRSFAPVRDPQGELFSAS